MFRSVIRSGIQALCKPGILVIAALLPMQPAFAQLTTGTFTGTVLDQSSAVVPSAKVILINEASQATRDTETNSVGYFAFAGVIPGTYTIKVEAPQFKRFTRTGMVMHPGDSRDIPDILLEVGNPTELVTVEATTAAIQLVDSGERSAVLSSTDIGRMPLISRNTSELLKALPGVTSVANTTSNGLAFDFSNAGATGSTVGVGLSTNGAPYRGGTALTFDGANILDPGCDCWSTAVINPNMTEEVKVQTSNFGADVAKGPVVVSAVSKSGGDAFHGTAYLDAKNAIFNSNTWDNNRNGAHRQDQAYYYPGGSFGGPVPGTHKKLFFWQGFEYWWQQLPSSSPLTSYVPTDGMKAGNFTTSGAGNAAVCSAFTSSATNWCNDPTGSILPDGTAVTNGVIPASELNTPSAKAAAAIMKMFPAANHTPTADANYNYYLPLSSQHNGYMLRSRVDYSISDNNKLFVSYQYGHDLSTVPAHLWWTPSYSVPFPGGGMTNPTGSHVLTGNFVHIFSPTLTNELVASWSRSDSPLTPNNLDAASRASLGFPYSTLLHNKASMIPSIYSAGAETFPEMSQPDLFEVGGKFDTRKPVPTVSDNLSKVIRSHTLKAGFYYENVDNNQGNYGYMNGVLNFNGQISCNKLLYSSCVSSGPGANVFGSNNPVVNLLLGISTAYQETSINPVDNLAYNTASFYGMDTWKVTRRLTVNYGARFDHIGRWSPHNNFGNAVWMGDAQYQADLAAGRAFPGLSWHSIDGAILPAGSPSPTLLASPRFGISWDVFGTGKTVVRGGWGLYRWNDQWNDYSAATNIGYQAVTYNSPSGNIPLDSLFSQTLSLSGGGGAVYPVDPHDNKLPQTESYNFTISQRMPWQSLVEVAYVGNHSNNLLLGGQSDGSGLSGNGYVNLNKIHQGSLFSYYGYTPGSPLTAAQLVNIESAPPNSLYPYFAGYGTNGIYVKEHAGWSNYNALQVSWIKQSRRLTYNVNYTWSKALGIVSNSVNAYSIAGNYGFLNIDRTHVINMSASYALGSAVHNNKLLGGVANGWTLSTITTWQSGANLQANYSQNMKLQIVQEYPGGSVNLDQKYWLGTDQGQVQPIASCGSFTASCFSLPAVGTNGMTTFPYLHGPAYFNSDLAIYKSFHITEKQAVEFRVTAANFPNHPLAAYQGDDPLRLKFVSSNIGQPFVLSPASTWGQLTDKVTQRAMQFGIKYSF